MVRFQLKVNANSLEFPLLTKLPVIKFLKWFIKCYYLLFRFYLKHYSKINKTDVSCNNFGKLLETVVNAEEIVQNKSCKLSFA